MAQTNLYDSPYFDYSQGPAPIQQPPKPTSWSAKGWQTPEELNTTNNQQNQGLGQSGAAQFARDIGPAGFVGVGAQAGQLALSYLPTAADKYSKGIIEDYEKNGAQGLSGQEANMYQMQLLNPIQALAGETNMRQEAERGAMAGTTSAGDILRGQNAAKQRIDSAALEAGTQIVAADIQKKNEELQEYKQALAQKSEKQKMIRSQWGQLFSQAAGVAGQAAAGRQQKEDATETINRLTAELGGTPEAHAKATMYVLGAQRQTFAPERNVLTSEVPYGSAGGTRGGPGFFGEQ